MITQVTTFSFQEVAAVKKSATIFNRKAQNSYQKILACVPWSDGKIRLNSSSRGGLHALVLKRPLDPLSHQPHKENKETGFQQNSLENIQDNKLK